MCHAKFRVVSELLLLLLLMIQPVSHVTRSWFWDTFVGYNWLMEFLFWFRLVLTFTKSLWPLGCIIPIRSLFQT